MSESFDEIKVFNNKIINKIRNSDYDAILTYIEIYGIHGYLNFEKNKNGEKKLKNISR